MKHTSLISPYKRVTRPVAKRLLNQGVQLYSSYFNGAIVKVNFASSSELEASELTLSKHWKANVKYYIEK